MLKVISDIDLFDQDMKSFLKIDLLKEYRRNKILVLVFIVTIFVCNILSCSYTLIIDQTNAGFFKSFVIFVLPSGIISFMCLQCCLMIIFLKKRFLWINQKFVQTTAKIEKLIPKAESQLGIYEIDTDNHDV